MTELLKKNFNNLATIGTIVLATFYLEDRINNSIIKAITPIESEITELKTKVKTLENSTLIYNFKVDAYEKYFTKPKEAKLEEDNHGL